MHASALVPGNASAQGFSRLLEKLKTRADSRGLIEAEKKIKVVRATSQVWAHFAWLAIRPNSSVLTQERRNPGNAILPCAEPKVRIAQPALRQIVIRY